jgi:hypothetical protein
VASGLGPAFTAAVIGDAAPFWTRAPPATAAPAGDAPIQIASTAERIEPLPEPAPLEGAPYWAVPAPPPAPATPFPEPSDVQGAPFWTIAAPAPERIEPLPEPIEVQGTPFWSIVAPAPERIEPLPEPAEIQGAPYWAVPVATPAPERIEPVPEPAELEGLPFWAQPAPPLAPERIEPLPEPGELLGAPFWTVPPPMPAAVTPAPAPQAVAVVPAVDPARVAFSLRRGTELLAVGDISGARRFLEAAARDGSGQAAFALAETFDPRAPVRRGVIGAPPDRATALQWYRRAQALGVAEAATRIATLEANR